MRSEWQMAESSVTSGALLTLRGGSSSLIELHTEYVLQAIAPDIPASLTAPAALSEILRRRSTTLAQLLFQLVIVRIYLRCFVADDQEIYFLTRMWTKAEYERISGEDRQTLDRARACHLGCRGARGWCKIGTKISKAGSDPAESNQGHRLEEHLQCKSPSQYNPIDIA
ncbi:hypothetical protein B0H13DRAFT_1868035 [Mycena leptocephala]|nr:hypothetical protein B0H13DRAFT_1868035 [Mycena leptocephala]